MYPAVFVLALPLAVALPQNSTTPPEPNLPQDLTSSPLPQNLTNEDGSPMEVGTSDPVRRWVYNPAIHDGPNWNPAWDSWRPRNAWNGQNSRQQSKPQTERQPQQAQRTWPEQPPPNRQSGGSSVQSQEPASLPTLEGQNNIPTNEDGYDSRGWGGTGEVLTFPNSSFVDYEAFKQQFVAEHNNARRKHVDTGDLEWDEDLAEDARKYSAQCVYQHGFYDQSNPGEWGQNMGAQRSGFRTTWDGQRVALTDEDKKPYYDPLHQIKERMNGWWEHERFLLDWNNFQVSHQNKNWVMDWLRYRFPKSGKYIKPQVGHFTQMIWAETTRVGCAVTVCRPLRGGTIHVPDNPLSTYTVCNYAKGGNVDLGNPWPGQDEWYFYRQQVHYPKNWDEWWQELRKEGTE